MMLSADPRPDPKPQPRARQPTVATRELLFAMAMPPVGRSEALWPSWLVPIAATWRRRPFRTHRADTRGE